MQLPLQISFRQMEHSPAMEATIREKAARLDTFAKRIMSCRVVVQPAGRHHVHGNQYEVHVAFDSAARQLEDYVRRQRGDVKSRARMPHGRVSKLVPDESYGLLVTPEGREIYFHRDSVLHDAFERLAVGTEVAFAEEEGDKGPQASTVKLVGRHGGL